MPSEVTPQTVRAGAYARYSSDSQRDASIDDQVRICRDEIERHGWHLVEVYADREHRAFGGPLPVVGRSGRHLNQKVPKRSHAS